MKIRPVGAELFYADRRTDMTKRIVVFRKLANVPKTRRFATRCFRNVAVFKKSYKNWTIKNEFMPGTF